MGNQNKKTQFDSSNWEAVTQIGPKTILKNITTHSLLDYYQYQHHNEAYTNQYLQSIYEWRQQITIQQHIPLLYHYEIQEPLLGSTLIQKVFTEHLTRFSELPHISKPQAFLILQHILEVLPHLFKQFGLFHVNVFTVGINDSGQTKVWINQNHAKNYAQPEHVIKKPSQNLELIIVNNLVRMLKTKVFNNEIKPEYPFSINFLDTLKFIKDTRQAFPQYNISKVYIDRNEFNQIFKAPSAQPSQLISQITPRRIAKEKQPYQEIKTPIYWQQPYFNIGQTPIRHPPLNPNPLVIANPFPINKIDTNPANSNQIIGPTNSINNQPIPRQTNNFMNIPPSMPVKRQTNLLEKSYYINRVNHSPNKIVDRKVTPPKAQEPRISPSKFIKAERKLVSQNTIKINRVGSNRFGSISPTKIHKQIKVANPIPQAYQPNVFVRPISSNIPNKKQLSRIIQEQDSRHARRVEKRVEGGSFNVELVQSIYIQSNETDQGP